MASKKLSSKPCTTSSSCYTYKVNNADRNARILARIEAIYTEIDLGRDNGGKHYTRAEINEMRREIAALRTELK